MEDLLTFAAVFTVLITILLIATSASLASFYQVADTQKRLVKNAKDTDILLLRLENNALVRTDKVLTIEYNADSNRLTVSNVGASDIFWVRLICWKLSDPGGTLSLIQGEQNGTYYDSVPYISIYSPYDEVNYTVEANSQCVLVGRRFVRGFVLPG